MFEDVCFQTNMKQALGKANVRVVHQELAEVTKNSCRRENGDEIIFDVLICATGFDTSYRPRFPIIGLEDLNLQDAWASKPSSYLGIAATGFPNFFFLLGPYSPIGNGPLHQALGQLPCDILEGCGCAIG